MYRRLKYTLIINVSFSFCNASVDQISRKCFRILPGIQILHTNLNPISGEHFPPLNPDEIGSGNIWPHPKILQIKEQTLDLYMTRGYSDLIVGA